VITKEHLKKLEIDDEKAGQIIELLGNAASKLYHEDGYKKAKDEVDLEVLTLTKIPKNNDERSSDYMKRAVGEYTEKIIGEKTTDLNGKIAELDKKVKEKPGDEGLKAELQALKDEKAKFPDIISEKVKEKEEELKKVREEYDKDKKLWGLRKSLPLKFKADVDPEFKEFKINQALTEAMKDYDVIEETADGTILKNSVNYNQKSAKEYFAAKLESIIDKGISQPGGGGGKGGDEGAGGDKKELKFDDDDTDSKKLTKIREYLATEKGLSSFDANYETEFNKLLKDNKLENYMTIKEKKE
jgi:hypothetical protein